MSDDNIVGDMVIHFKNGSTAKRRLRQSTAISIRDGFHRGSSTQWVANTEEPSWMAWKTEDVLYIEWGFHLDEEELEDSKEKLKEML